jgi:release factor glutamine methyltransferase
MEPALALDGGDDGLHIIRKIISRAPEFLCKGGSLLLEADPRQMPAISDLYKEAGFSDIQTHKDLSGRERVISGITT